MTDATHRRLNFGPGPAALPWPVLERAREELLELPGTGMSILEHSHRGPAYEAIHDHALHLVREVLGVPDTHEVLLLQGGARAQFALVPMNLAGPGRRADYVLTGSWAEQAHAEAALLGPTRVAASTREADGGYRRVPRPDEIALEPGAAYLHVTTNNTIYGTQLHALPETGDLPLCADATSDLASRALDPARFGVLYAAAQKNLGIAGLTLVIVRRDLIRDDLHHVPTIFRWSTAAKARSLHNTIPTFAVYVLGLVLEWIRAEGGLPAMDAASRRKAERLYGALEAHAPFYSLPVEPASRSLANVVYRLPDAELEARYLVEASREGMVGLKGHRAAGGVRASLYNGVLPAWVDALADFSADFARRHG